MTLRTPVKQFIEHGRVKRHRPGQFSRFDSLPPVMKRYLVRRDVFVLQAVIKQSACTVL
jgi:hypothetical protein